MSTVIKVENLSKQYRLGQVGTGTISHDVNRWWHKIRGKEDPYLKIGESNDRTVKGESDYVWALKDINFEVKQGEVLGIIGRNGAGKSTLLKILSRTTAPTTGSVKIKGRVASLLEVGTGFHPELSGRDNIFLNGAILGMTRREIQSNFDEIVDFAGVERYIDTPVKRYSSGMYVRLAFAVAAHLEPEILIVDEVLAVGDADFQNKCLGKMKDVSEKQGRTVLFVSHDMSAISRLSNFALLLNNGTIKKRGSAKEVIKWYVEKRSKIESQYVGNMDPNKKILFSEIKLTNVLGNQSNSFNISDDIRVQLKILYPVATVFKSFTVMVIIQDMLGRKIFSCIKDVTDPSSNLDLIIFKRQITRGAYSLNVIAYQLGNEVFDNVQECCSFEIIDTGSEYDGLNSFDYGVTFGKYQWIDEKINY
jgi:lipopolysaccharide transport system ATP-binding protein